MSKKITLNSSDGKSFEVDQVVTEELQTIKHLIEDDCVDNHFPLPNVTSTILVKVIEYSKKHVESSKSEDKVVDEDLKICDAEFMKPSCERERGVIEPDCGVQWTSPFEFFTGIVGGAKTQVGDFTGLTMKENTVRGREETTSRGASKYLIRIREMMARYEELCPYGDPFWEGFVAGVEERTIVISQFFIFDVDGRTDVGDDIVPPLLGTISGYGKLWERFQDFQKSSIVQISCTFYGMKTKKLGCTYVCESSGAPPRNQEKFDVAHPS
ncbi:hypothetical protein GIB67_007337 [Kingdonia uniflora]|uniref:SKP1 component POZ domain-containing protein n=1 Tax=Kingdonia uniflora TaxID=39325 RepID=A0A7J7NX82_9MAGN|nr:hypothetical protein GIB67_007337 [Kingdonia uniflora]